MAGAAPVLVHGYTGEALSNAPRDGDSPDTPHDIRLFSRGEQAMISIYNDAKGLLNEGSYNLAATPTPGTGITLTVATGTTFLDTQGLVSIDNIDTGKAQGGSGKVIYPDFIAWVVTTAPTSATDHQIAGRLDYVTRGSGGTVVTVYGSAMQYGTSSVASVRANPTLIAASGQFRPATPHLTIRKAAAPAYIVGDLVVLKFGGVEWSNALANFISTTQTAIIVPVPGVAIGPGQSYVLNEWATARAAALSGELYIGLVER